MKVRFVRDFRGRLTQEAFYPAGTVADLPPWTAQALAAEGAAEVLPEPEAPAPEVPPAPRPKRKKETP